MLDIRSIKVGTIYREADEQIRKYDKCCKKGCSYCCKQVIKIIAIEELLITEYIRKSINGKVKKLIKINVIDWLDFFDQNTPDRQLNQDDIIQFEKLFSFNNKKCPFLFNNECAIYQARPIVCRTHIVKDNPDACKLDPLRDSIKEAIIIKYAKLKQLYNLDKSSNNTTRLLPYALADFFSIKREFKPIISIEPEKSNFKVLN